MGRLARRGVLEVAADPVRVDHQVVKFPLGQHVLELAVGNRPSGGADRREVVLENEQRQHREEDVPDLEMVFALDWHKSSLRFSRRPQHRPARVL